MCVCVCMNAGGMILPFKEPPPSPKLDATICVMGLTLQPHNYTCCTCTTYVIIMGGLIPQILYGSLHLNRAAVHMSIGELEAEQPSAGGGEVL